LDPTASFFWFVDVVVLIFRKSGVIVFLANFTASMMAIGLIVHVRNLQMVEDTWYGTVAWYEFTRAAEFGLLITILTMPWLILAAILLGI
jgi:hypothetical protein